jgi:hypothetical protein
MLGVFICLVLQYVLNGLAYLELFPNVYGKSLNGIIKNTSYIIPGCLAIFLAYLFEGRVGLQRIFTPYFKLAHPLWFLFSAICLILPLYLALFLDDLLYAAILNEKLGSYGFIWPTWQNIVQYTPSFVLVAMSDELFWIGFIYPRLLSLGIKPLKASLLIGFLWGLDYLPFLFTEFFLSPGLNAPNLVFGWFAVAPLYIWIYHMTHSALIIVFFNVCMQYLYNAVPVLPINSGDNSEAAMVNITVLVFGILLWKFTNSKQQGPITNMFSRLNKNSAITKKSNTYESRNSQEV